MIVQCIRKRTSQRPLAWASCTLSVKEQQRPLLPGGWGAGEPGQGPHHPMSQHRSWGSMVVARQDGGEARKPVCWSGSRPSQRLTSRSHGDGQKKEAPRSGSVWPHPCPSRGTAVPEPWLEGPKAQGWASVGAWGWGWGTEAPRKAGHGH